MFGDNDIEIETNLKEDVTSVMSETKEGDRVTVENEDPPVIAGNLLTKNDVDEIINNIVTDFGKKMKNLESKMEAKIADIVENLNEKHLSAMEIMKNNIVCDYEEKIACLKSDNDDQLKEIKNKFDAKSETLLLVIAQKDAAINKLNENIGELQKSVEVTDSSVKINKECIDTLNYHAEEQLKELNYLVDKSSDLEDRSKRHNLIFKGFTEETGRETNEDCEKKLRNLIVEKSMLNGKALISFDRVHRLGRKKNDARGSRPIICKVTSYKDKETILKNAAKLRGSRISMCEDYSQQTQEINNQLFSACKAAKDIEESPVQKFYVNYKYASVHFKNGSKRNFNLKQIQQNSGWYNITERNF